MSTAIQSNPSPAMISATAEWPIIIQPPKVTSPDLNFWFVETFGKFKGSRPGSRMGGEFLNKVFDHSVLVPELTASQTQRMIDLATGFSASHSVVISTDSLVAKRAREARERVTTALKAAARVGHRSPDLQEAIANPDLDRRDRLEAEIARVQAEATVSATEARARHLLAAYYDLLPPNPRMIKRIANAWGMLLAVQSCTGHTETRDTMARAAILYVGYPDLLSAVRNGDDTLLIRGRLQEGNGMDRRLERLLTRLDGSHVPLESVARCYGWGGPPVDAEAHLDAGL